MAARAAVRLPDVGENTEVKWAARLRKTGVIAGKPMFLYLVVVP